MAKPVGYQAFWRKLKDDQNENQTSQHSRQRKVLPSIQPAEQEHEFRF
jgi:hypothetical protein